MIRTMFQFGLVCFFVGSIAQSLAAGYKLETLRQDLHYPGSVAFLPGGDFLIAERSGQLVRVSADGKEKTTLSGVPETYFDNQGGFFDVVLHPQFETNNKIYLSYAHGGPQANGTAVISAVLGDKDIQQSKLILLIDTLKDTSVHYGGRLLFLPDNTLLITTGEGFEYREKAQDLNTELGKVLRVDDRGIAPADNPFKSRVWTYGHRNPQGLALNSKTGDIYLHEHGPRGGDELNILTAGANYGWPAITQGIDYSGAHVTPFTELEGMEQPEWFWVPSIGPSGLTWYGGNVFPEWHGDLFVGALIDEEVRRLDMENGKVIAEESMFTEIGERIRDIRSGPDGYLYILTDTNQGQLIRVVPDK